MKNLLMAALMGLGTTMAFGQVTDLEKDVKSESKDTLDGWKKGGYFSLSGTQVSLTNWVAGGQNSVSINGLFGLYANLKKGSMTWENSMEFGYGILRQSNQLFQQNGTKWIKTDDRIDITSKYGKRASESWYYAGLLNFRTQSTAGYAYPDDQTEISGFMAPGYLLGAIGMDYKPNNSNFSLFVAPITAKLTFVNDTILANAGSFGVREAFTENNVYTPGRQFRAELGGYLRMNYKRNLTDNITFSTNLDLFTNYIENQGRIDVNWNTLIELKLWKFLSANLSTQLIYDDDIDIQIKDDAGEVTAVGPRVQFKEVLGVGLSWKFDQK